MRARLVLPSCWSPECLDWRGGVPVEWLRHMIYAYPTFYRGIEDALRDLS